MEPNISKLISELETGESLQVDNLRIPTEESVEALGRTGDPAAIPALKKALEESLKFKEMVEGLQRNVDPFAAGSASPALAAVLANQVIEKIREAISNCSST